MCSTVGGIIPSPLVREGAWNKGGRARRAAGEPLRPRASGVVELPAERDTAAAPRRPAAALGQGATLAAPHGRPFPHTRALAALGRPGAAARICVGCTEFRHRSGAHRRRAFHDVRHRLQHLGIGAASIGPFRVRRWSHYTDTHRFRAAWDDERYLVPGLAWLYA